MGDWWQTGGMVDVWANGVSIPRLNGLPVDLTGFSFSFMLVTFFFPFSNPIMQEFPRINKQNDWHKINHWHKRNLLADHPHQTIKRIL